MATFIGTVKTDSPKVTAVKITAPLGVPRVTKTKISESFVVSSLAFQNQPSLVRAAISTANLSNILIQKIKVQNRPILTGLVLQDGGRILIKQSKIQAKPKTNKAVLALAIKLLKQKGLNKPNIKRTGLFNSPKVNFFNIEAAKPFSHKRFTSGTKLFSNTLKFTFGKHPNSIATIKANIPAFSLDRGEEFSKANILSAPQIIPNLSKDAKIQILSNIPSIRPTKGLKSITNLLSTLATVSDIIRVFGSSAGIKSGRGAIGNLGQNLFNTDFIVNVIRPIDTFDVARALSLAIPSRIEKSPAKVKSQHSKVFTHGQVEGIVPGTKSPVGINAGKQGTKDLVLDFGAVKVSRSQITSQNIVGFVQRIQLKASSQHSKVITHGQVEGIVPGTKSPVGINAGIVSEGDFDRFKLGSGSKDFHSAGNKSGASVKDQGTWLGVIAGARSYGPGGYWNQIYPFSSDFWFPQYGPHLVAGVATGFGGGQNIAFSGQPPIDADGNFNTEQAFRFVDGNPTRKVYDNQARYLAQKFQYYTEKNGLLDPRTGQPRQKVFDTNNLGIADTYISATRIPFKFPFIRIQTDFFLKNTIKGRESFLGLNAGTITEGGIDRFVLGRGEKRFSALKASNTNIFSSIIVAGAFKQNKIGVRSPTHVPKYFIKDVKNPQQIPTSVSVNAGTITQGGVDRFKLGSGSKYFHSSANTGKVNFTHYISPALAKGLIVAATTESKETKQFTKRPSGSTLGTFSVGVRAGKRGDYPGSFFFNFDFNRVNAAKAQSLAIPTISFPKTPIRTTVENIFRQVKVINAGDFAPNNNGVKISLQDFDVRFLHFAFNIAGTKSSNLARGHYYGLKARTVDEVSKTFRPGTIINQPVYLRSNQPIFTMPFRITGVGAKTQSKDVIGKLVLNKTNINMKSSVGKTFRPSTIINFNVGLISQELEFTHGLPRLSKFNTESFAIPTISSTLLSVKAKSVFDLIYKLHTQESIIQLIANQPLLTHKLGQKDLKTDVKSVFDLIYKLHTQESITRLISNQPLFTHKLGRKVLETNVKSKASLLYKLHTQESLTNTVSSMIKGPAKFNSAKAKSVFDLIYKLHTQESNAQLVSNKPEFTTELGIKKLNTNVKALFFPAKLQFLNTQVLSETGKLYAKGNVQGTVSGVLSPALTIDVLESINSLLVKSDKANVTSRFFTGLLDAVKANIRTTSLVGKTIGLTSYKYTSTLTLSDLTETLTRTENHKATLLKFLWVPPTVGTSTNANGRVYSYWTNGYFGGPNAVPFQFHSTSYPTTWVDHWNPVVGIPNVNITGGVLRDNPSFTRTDDDGYWIIQFEAPADYQQNTGTHTASDGYIGNYDTQEYRRDNQEYRIVVQNLTRGSSRLIFMNGNDIQASRYEGGVYNKIHFVLNSSALTILSNDNIKVTIIKEGITDNRHDELLGSFTFTAGSAEIRTPGKSAGDALHSNSMLDIYGRVWAYGYEKDLGSGVSTTSYYDRTNVTSAMNPPYFGGIGSNFVDSRVGKTTTFSKTVTYPNYVQTFTVDENTTPLWTGNTQVKSNVPNKIFGPKKASQSNANSSGFAYSQNYTVNHDFDGSYVGTEITF